MSEITKPSVGDLQRAREAGVFGDPTNDQLRDLLRANMSDDERELDDLNDRVALLERLLAEAKRVRDGLRDELDARDED